MDAVAKPGDGLNIGQILDRIFRLLRNNARPFLQLGIVPSGAILAFYALLGGPMLLTGVFSLPPHAPFPHRAMVSLLAGAATGGLLVVVAYTVFEAAATYMALQANSGEPISFRAAYGFAWRKAGRYLWLMILRALVVGVPVSLPFLVFAGLTAMAVQSEHGQLTPGLWFLLFPLVALLYIGALVYAFWMGLRLALAPAACVAEGLTARGALRRSSQLTRNALARIFLVLLVVYAAGYLLLLGVELAGTLLVGLVALPLSLLHVGFALPWKYVGIGIVSACGLILLLLWMAALWSSYAVALAVLYHDQRYRIEGVSPSSLIPGTV